MVSSTRRLPLRPPPLWAPKWRVASPLPNRRVLPFLLVPNSKSSPPQPRNILHSTAAIRLLTPRPTDPHRCTPPSVEQISLAVKSPGELCLPGEVFLLTRGG